MGASKNSIKTRGQGGKARKSAVYTPVHEHFSRISNAAIAASADF
jgi:hypothetical protein